MEKMVFISYENNHNDPEHISCGEFNDNGELILTSSVYGEKARNIYEMLIPIKEDRKTDDMVICYICDDDTLPPYKYEMKVTRFEPEKFTKDNGDLTILSVSYYMDLSDGILNFILGGNN